MVAGLQLNKGNTNALIVRLQEKEDTLNAFINQVNAFKSLGRITEAQAAELIFAARETIRHIAEK